MEDHQTQSEPIGQDRPQHCGTAILRRGLGAMTEEDREAILDILEKGGLIKAI
jgi:hypothetical protein